MCDIRSAHTPAPSSVPKKTEKAEPAVQKPVKQKKDLFHYLSIRYWDPL